CDSLDADLCETALRETYEEVGVQKTNIQILRPLTELYIPPSNFLVTPFMGISNDPLTFYPNPDEVQRILEIPLDKILSEIHWTTRKIKTSYAVSIDVPGWEIEGEFIWGATAMMLSEVKACLNKVLESS
ncbi:CoA pyrophosphatase, partial [Arthrospira platensis SPKY1]|nr:CoA pyrophosphatase [Arthrospira platensis SPKY1]